VPPLALLALALSAEEALALGSFLILGVSGPVILSTVLCILFLAAIVLAWWRHARTIIPLRWLIFAPLYALLKVPLYGRFFWNRQRAWARGER